MHGDADFIDLRGSQKTHRVLAMHAGAQKQFEKLGIDVAVPAHPCHYGYRFGQCPAGLVRAVPGSQRFEDIRNRQYPRG